MSGVRLATGRRPTKPSSDPRANALPVDNAASMGPKG
jgi:hypothetical protein